MPSLPQTEPPLACVWKSRWIDWAEHLKRVFALEVLVLRLSKDACGGRRRVLSVIKVEQVARKILEHLGLPRHELSTIPFRFVVVGKRGPSRRER